MFKRKIKAFTLIELIGVLVIMAIIALIVTPLVMNIIRSARISADKRSIDAYGRSIELAIAGYLLDTGKFPTEVSQLTIEYSGNEVVCETTAINPDSSVFLSNCKVNNREVTNYSYGTDKSPSYEAYSVGDEVTYNGVDYYVLKDSGTKDNVVTLLKATPLTTEEVNTYGGVGTDNNHVNRYTNTSVGTAFNVNGYGGVAYYSSDLCRESMGSLITSGCINDYIDSDIKYIVDKWAEDKVVPDKYVRVRLITFQELIDNLGYEYRQVNTDWRYIDTDSTQPWVYDNYVYWTMSLYDDSNWYLWYVTSTGLDHGIIEYSVTVRPVVELYKNDGITRKNS